MHLDLPTLHRVPVSWLLEHGSESIRLRTRRELAYPGTIPPEAITADEEGVAQSKLAQAVVKKQKDTGIWGGNLLGLAPSAKDGIKETGTIPNYRRLLQLGYPKSGRPYKLTDRVLFRLLSRDDDPALQFEFAKLSKDSPAAAEWAREHMREAAAAALAEAGFIEDPRLRGAAHKIASAVSAFLRSPLAEKPYVRSGAKTILNPEAHPPTWYSVAMIAAMPNLQRERAGFTERLGQYLGTPMSKKAYVWMIGKRVLKPELLLLGDPIVSDAKGNAKDIPLALHFIELLARISALHTNPVATKVLARLFSECDPHGVWRPKGLKTAPRAIHKVTYHTYPTHLEAKSNDSKLVDVTFRLALIARLLGIALEYH
ncbi:MAG: hypothetical protein HOP28_13865 [Gemmatimonadales bacterium]|nr:hypothetical protein [Gemmatimonadales bacterium]